MATKREKMFEEAVDEIQRLVKGEKTGVLIHQGKLFELNEKDSGKNKDLQDSTFYRTN